MYRNIINDLAKWYQESQEKVLFVKGARGVGKSWTVDDFSSAFFESSVMIDLRNDVMLSKSLNSDGIRLEEHIMDMTGINIPKEKILIIFDELQVIEHGIDKVMNFRKEHPEYRYCIIASFVGKLEGEDDYNDSIVTYTLMPMTFEEFLTANKAQNLCKYIEQQRIKPVEAAIIEKIMEYLKIFFVVGGMPAVVAEYVKNGNLSVIEILQKEILDEQREYIKANAPKIIVKKILKIWDSIPVQLSKENRKFMYGYVDPKARAREYESSTHWLVDNGLLRRVYRVEQGVSPLSDYVDKKSFELYHLDHGLLRQMAGFSAIRLLDREDIFDVMKGALTEQMVLAELTLNQTVGELYFWISGATARVDFLFEDDGEVIPVDVQSTIRTKAQSIKVFHQKYNNRMAIRISLGSLGFSKGILNIPLYGLWNF